MQQHPADLKFYVKEIDCIQGGGGSHKNVINKQGGRLKERLNLGMTVMSLLMIPQGFAPTWKPGMR